MTQTFYRITAGGVILLFLVLGERANDTLVLWVAFGLYVLIGVTLLSYLLFIMISPRGLEEEERGFVWSIEHLALLLLVGIIVNTVFLRVAHVLFSAEYTVSNANVMFSPQDFFDRLYFVTQATAILGFGEILPLNTAARIATLCHYILTPTVLLSLLASQTQDS